MAWTDQCKIAFMVNAKGRYARGDSKSLRKIFRDLSHESGIPAKTLERWYYEKTDPKNEAGVSGGNNGDKPSIFPSRSMNCIKCEENTVKINPSSGKPYSQNSKYYGLCGRCLSRADRLRIRCPHCQKVVYLNKEGTIYENGNP